MRYIRVKPPPHTTLKLNFSGLALKWCYISKGILLGYKVLYFKYFRLRASGPRSMTRATPSPRSWIRATHLPSLGKVYSKYWCFEWMKCRSKVSASASVSFTSAKVSGVKSQTSYQSCGHVGANRSPSSLPPPALTSRTHLGLPRWYILYI